MKVFKNGLITGLILQLAIGPVFLYIINIALQRSVFDGLVAVLAVAIVDYFYIALAIFGVGKLLENKKIKKIFGIITSLVLIVFGFIILKDIIFGNLINYFFVMPNTLFGSFVSVFLLTIANPMTIVFFTSLFATKAIEYNYKNRQLIIFGLATGLATILFMGASVLIFSLIKNHIPYLIINILNTIVGFILILYGGIRLWKIIKLR